MPSARVYVTFSWNSCIAKHSHGRPTNWCGSPGRVLARFMFFSARSSGFTTWLGARNGIPILIHSPIRPRNFCRTLRRKNAVWQDTAHGCPNAAGWKSLGTGSSRTTTLSSFMRHGNHIPLMTLSCTVRFVKVFHALACVNTERMAIDRQGRRLDALDDGDPLFLSRRGNPYDYDSFKKHWYKLCAVLQLDLNIHALRHWFVTQEIRLICETAKEPGDIERGKEDLVRYMAWRSPETLQCYEHYFDEIRHAELQDRLHTRWSEDNARYAREHTDVSSARSPFGPTSPLPSVTTETPRPSDQGWDSLLSLGGYTHA